MKRIKWLEIALILALFILITYAVVLSLDLGHYRSELFKDNQSPVIHYALITDDKSSQSAIDFFSGMEDAIREYNIVLETTLVNEDETSLNQAFDIAEQMKVDGIIVKLKSNSEAKENIIKMQQNGIFTVLVGNDSPESYRDVYIGSNKFNAGKVSAALATEGRLDKAKVLLLLGRDYESSSGSAKNNFLNGFRPANSEGMDLEVVFIGYTAQTRAELLLEKHLSEDSINTVICTDPLDTTRVMNLLVDLNRVSDIRLIGSGDLEATLEGIKKGIVYASINLGFDIMGDEAIRALIALNQEESQSSYVNIEINVLE
jgi:ribose transport system substrate-binding protein